MLQQVAILQLCRSHSLSCRVVLAVYSGSHKQRIVLAIPALRSVSHRHDLAGAREQLFHDTTSFKQLISATEA